MDTDVSGHALRNSQRVLKSFVEAYKASPELWDPYNINYTKKFRREKAQDNLLSIYKHLQDDATREDVRNKINTLRTYYNKEIAKVRAAEAEGREYIPKNWLFHELRFLDAIKKPDCQIESENEENGEAENDTSDVKVENTYTTLTNIVNVDQTQGIVEDKHFDQQTPTDTDVSVHALRNSQRILKSFLEAYKASPELWDPNNIHYTNKYRRVEAQDNLLSIYKHLQYDATRVDVRKKINTLRSNYNKEIAKVRAAEAEGREYIPKSWLFHELRFLDALKKPDCQIESENEENGETENDTVDIKVENTYTLTNIVNVDQTQGVVEDKHFDERTQSSAPKAKKIKRTISPRRTFDKHLMNGTPTYSTGIEPIALVWSSKLQKLRPSQRIFAEKAINDILFEAYLNNLGKGPLVINTGVSSVSTEAEGYTVEVPEEYIEYDSTDEEA